MFIGKFKNNKPFPDKLLWNRGDQITYDQVSSVCVNDRIKVYFWGVLYNRKSAVHVEGLSDAAIVAQMYERSGSSAFSCLDGSFTFVVSDSEQIIIVRDHHGTNKPVYYTNFFFASSLALLQETDGFITEPDCRALSDFLYIGYISTPSSSLKGVNKLGAGEMLVYRDGQSVVRQLYLTDDILPAQNDKSLDELSEQYGALHIEAIKKRIGDNSNIGILLSGGYDSGCNLVALRKIYSGDIRSYSIGFKGDIWTELPLAGCMSETFGTIHTEYEIDGSEIAALPKIVDFLGDPFVEGGLMVNYAVMKLIGNSQPDVILGGDGSDQYFGTSGREIALHYLLSKYKLAPVFGLIYHLLSQPVFDKNNRLYRIRFHLDKILNILKGDLFGFPDFRLKTMLQDRSLILSEREIRSDLQSFEHLYLQHAYKTDLEKIINQVILFKASRMADMFGNTMAFPYMDLDIYNFLQQLPVHYKCKGTDAFDIAKGHVTAKYLLKYHYKPMLPEVITSKKKQGGFAPMPLFFKNDKQRARIADFIMTSSVTRDFLKRDAVNCFIKQYDQDVNENGNWFWYKQSKAIQYFNLYTLALWWERFIEQNHN